MRFVSGVPRQNSIHAKNNAILPPSQREKSNSSKNCFEEREGSLGWERAHATYISCYLYIRMAEKIVRIRPPDRNDDGARRVARKKGCDPQVGNESCGQVFP